VQGVGFRPFVYGLASDLKLGGFVKNETGGVKIEVEGDAPSLDQFLSRLISSPPPLAQIDHWTCQTATPCGERGFRIDPSDRAARGDVVVTPDAATCDACLAELFDPDDRRYRYPFLNCTPAARGSRSWTGAPYDRERTTMARFILCPLCQAEYEDPSNRRFHAQPNAWSTMRPAIGAAGCAGRLPFRPPTHWLVLSKRCGREKSAR